MSRSRILIALAAIGLVGLLLFFFGRSTAPVAPAPDASTSGSWDPARDPAVQADFVATATIEGVVLGTDGKPASRAIVAVRGERVRRATTTDERGRFTVQSLRAGSFDVSATAPTGEAAQSTLRLESGATAHVELRLANIEGAVSLSGHVRDVLGGSVSGAEVWIGAEAVGAISVLVHTNEKGEFTARVARGKRELRVRAPGYAEGAEQIDLTSDLAVEVVVNPAASIRGTVVSADGKPARGARVIASGGLRIETTSDDEGHFELKDLPSTSFDIVARTTSEVGRLIGVNVVPAVTRDVLIDLQAAASVVGQVRANGAAVGGAKVNLQIDDEQGEEVTAGADGRFRFAGVPRGSIVVSACAPKYSCAQSKSRVALPGKSNEIDVELGAAGGTLRVRVLDKDEKPVSGASAHLAQFEGCTTGVDGTCSIENISERKSKLSVEHVLAGYAEESIDIGTREAEHVVHLKFGATVRGTVRWDDGKPASDVMVFDSRIVTRTDAQGRYELRNVRPPYVHVSAAGALELGERGLAQRYELPHGPDDLITVKAGEVKEGIDVVIPRKTKAIAGTVIASDGTPVPFATVGMQIDDPESPWRAEHAGIGPDAVPATYSGPDGTFTIDDVGKGTYVVWAQSEEHPVGRARKVVGGTRDVKVTLPAGAVLEGNVHDERGAAVTDFVVRSTHRFTTERPRRVSDPQGHFVIGGLRAGEHEVVVETDPPDVRIVRLNEKLAVGERKKIDVVVKRAVTVTGRIVSWPDMKPEPGITLHLSGPTRRSSTPSGADGRFTIEGSPEGNVELYAWDAHGQHEEWQRTLVVKDARADIGDLAFVPGRKYAHPFSFDVDGVRAITTGRGNTGGVAVGEGDEVLSIGGVPVATLSPASLASLCQSSKPDVPFVVKKKGATEPVTIHNVPRPGAKHPADDDE